MRHYYINEEVQKERLEKRKNRMPIYALSKNFKKLLIIFGIIILIFLLHYAANHTKEDDINIMNAIESEFKGKFTILSSEKDRKGNVTYLISDNNGIEFKAYKSGSTRRFDYQDKLTKKYLLEYLEENHLTENENIFIEEQPYTADNSQFSHTSIVMVINSFSKIEDTTKQMNQLYKAVCKKVAKHTQDSSASIYAYIRSRDLNINFLNVSYLSDEKLVARIKTMYVNDIQKNKITDLTITEKDIEKYWHPDELMIYINNEAVMQTFSNMFGTTRTHQAAHYNAEKEQYYLNVRRALSYIPGVINIQQAPTGLVFGFSYQGNDYSFDGNLTSAKGFKLPYDISITDFENIFHAKITMDFEAERMDIEI